jgi:hypothetical protein
MTVGLWHLQHADVLGEAEAASDRSGATAFIKKHWHKHEDYAHQDFGRFLEWCVDVVGKREESAQGHFRHSGIDVIYLWKTVSQFKYPTIYQRLTTPLYNCTIKMTTKASSISILSLKMSLHPIPYVVHPSRGYSFFDPHAEEIHVAQIVNQLKIKPFFKRQILSLIVFYLNMLSSVLRYMLLTVFNHGCVS